MTVDTFEISDEQASKILGIPEGHFSELKRKELKPAKTTISLSAFANSDGGDLYIGIGEEKQKDETKERFWQGFQDPEEANGHLQVIQGFFPFTRYINVSFLKNRKQDGLIIHAQVTKSKGVLKASDSFPYIRRGAQNIKVKKPEDIKRLEFDKGTISYEQQLLNIPISFITNSKVSEHFIKNVVPTSESESWLTKQLLIQSSKPTVAATLLFTDEPQAALPKQSGVKIYRYKTREKEGTRQTLAFDPVTIEGDIYSQINKSVSQTIKVIEGIKILGKKNLEEITYPVEVIHEIITNAVLHRDYSITADIHIVIFDNRIEVISPGKLPGHITPHNILDEQFARNGALVRIIHKFPNPPNKDVGEGLNTAFNAMRKLRLKEPIIFEKEQSVNVTIFHESLASPEQIVMKHLLSQGEIANSEARKICGIESENVMKQVFVKLARAGLLERTPGKKGSSSTWRKPKDPNVKKDLDSPQFTLDI